MTAAHEPDGEIAVGARRLGLRSAFAFGYCAAAMAGVPFGVVMGPIALFGGPGVAVNGQATFGPAGLVAGVLIGLFLPLVPAILMTLGTLLLRVPLPFGPKLRFGVAGRRADGHGAVSETT